MTGEGVGRGIRLHANIIEGASPDSSVSAIYDQHRYAAEARDWLQKWADYLEALTVRNVVPLRAA